jgi:hypothetical protein
MHRGGTVAVGERVLRVSTTFRRSVERLGVLAGATPFPGCDTTGTGSPA